MTIKRGGFEVQVFAYVGRWVVVCLTMVLFLTGCRQQATSLEDQILQTLSEYEGDFAVAFHDLETGERLLINEHATFHAASTMKTPVMIEVFKQVAAGTLRLSDSIPVRNSFSSIVDSSTFSLSIDDDSEGLLYTRIGSKVPLSDLVYQMIIASSNLATNIIIELVGASNVTRSMRDLGAPDIQILRGVEDTKAFEAGLNNTTTAYDLMVIFEKIASGEAVDTASSKAMIDILRDQTFNSIIPAMLPRDVVVAHKTGNITGVHHDSGVVELPDGRKYVLVLLSKNLKDVQGATKAMSEVSFLLYNHISGV
jgi:beta-lactamase class A